MSQEKFSLKWNEFEKNILSTFKDLREEKELFDITLVSDEEYQTKAHKLILSSSSFLFKKIISKNPHQHPLLYLKGISSCNLDYVISFIYNGEVSVAQDDLDSFLAAAEELQIKGLSQGKALEPPKNKVKNIPQSTSPYRKSNQLQKSSRDAAKVPSSTLVNVKSEAEEILDYDEENYDELGDQGDYQLGYDGTQESEEVDYSAMHSSDTSQDSSEMLAETMDAEGRQSWKCLCCGKEFNSKGNGKRHVQQIHLEAPHYSCEVCGKILKNKNVYYNHINLIHGIKKRNSNNASTNY